MSVGETRFSDNDLVFEHDDWETALEYAWDNADLGDETITIYEGVIGPNTFWSYEANAEVHEIIDVKQRHFKVLKFSMRFDPEDFEEIIS